MLQRIVKRPDLKLKGALKGLSRRKVTAAERLRIRYLLGNSLALPLVYLTLAELTALLNDAEARPDFYREKCLNEPEIDAQATSPLAAHRLSTIAYELREHLNGRTTPEPTDQADLAADWQKPRTRGGKGGMLTQRARHSQK